MALHQEAPCPPSFAQLLESAVTEPGLISSAYRQLHHYSFGNQLLAWSQCMARGLQPGPLATYPRWKELGRHVRRGEKAITLCRPVTVKRTTTADDGKTQSLRGLSTSRSGLCSRRPRAETYRRL